MQIYSKYIFVISVSTLDYFLLLARITDYRSSTWHNYFKVHVQARRGFKLSHCYVYFFTGFLGIISWPEFQPKPFAPARILSRFICSRVLRRRNKRVANDHLVTWPTYTKFYEYSWKDGLSWSHQERYQKKKKKNVVFIYLIKILDRRPCVPMISIDISIFLREKEKKKGETIIPYAMKSQISEGAKRIKTRSSKYIFPRQSKIRKHSEKIIGSDKWNWWNDRCLRLNKKKKKRKKKKKNKRKEDWTRSKLANETARKIRTEFFVCESLPEAR